MSKVQIRKDSLSYYYPKGIAYFYAYPAGEDSNFVNNFSPLKTELVSGRPLVCAGNDVKVVTFAACVEDYVLNSLSKSINLISKDNIIKLPSEISIDTTGSIRNYLIKSALKKLMNNNQLVMAQPFLDSRLHKKFNIKPEITIKFNDKINRNLYIPERFIPKIYSIFHNGEEYYHHKIHFPIPCVVKITSSSSGDGVYICRSKTDLEESQKLFSNVKDTIFVEEYIEFKHSLCIQIGIPYDRSLKSKIIGFNESLISANGKFLAGIVNQKKKIPYLKNVKEAITDLILPKIRALGWYGICGIEVLIREDGTFYFIDPNFRMTATYPYIYLVNNNIISMPLVSFLGTITCETSVFEEKILSQVEGKGAALKIISLTVHKNSFRFDACIQFDSLKDLKLKARKLLDLGVISLVLTNIVQPDFIYELN